MYVISHLKITVSEDGGKASRTRIASIPQFTHKHRLAATRSPYISSAYVCEEIAVMV